jgi:DNA primase
MIPDAIVEEVRARADIVEIIGESVPLRRSGREFKALCPFHSEKTPSFYVIPAKNFYNCFGCGESGDVFTFLMKRNGLGFSDAVRHVAARVGVEIPETASPSQDEPHRRLYEVIAFAADLFRRTLLESPDGEPARLYLSRRGLDAGALERFQLGWAPDAWRRVREAAHHHGYDDDVLLEAGLIKESEHGGEPYDRFRARVIFPIATASNRLIAFGGRVLGAASEGAPKYLNSPETPIYRKGETLYGLNWSKTAIRREGSALVVEGFMDYVSLAAHGVEHVVAGLGTALTAEQASLIARYAGRAYLLYDSDPAGLRATFRSADALLRAGVHPLVVTLPEGEDPDSLVRARGAGALREAVERGTDVLERKLEMLEARGFFEAIEGSRRALDRLLPTLRAVIDPALRDIYIGRVAARTGVRPETLERELSVRPDPFAGGTAPARGASPRRAASREERVPRTLAGVAADRLLLLLLLRDPHLVGRAVAVVTPDAFRRPEHRAIFEALSKARMAEDAAVGPAVGLDAAAAVELAALQAERQEITDAERTFHEVVAALRARPLLEEHARLLNALETATGPELEALTRRRAELSGLLRELGRGSYSTNPRSRGYARQLRVRRQPSTEDG